MILIHFLRPNPGAAAETNKLRLRPHIFEFGTFSFRIEKFPRPQVFTFEFVRPQVSDTYPDSL